jgi:hypothetical protein
MPHDVAGLIRLSAFQGFSFLLLLGMPAEALPPRAAMRWRSSALSFSFRASPALRAISDRSAAVKLFDRALPPSLPSAEACGLGFLTVILDTLSYRYVRVKEITCRTACGPTIPSVLDFPN